MQRASIQSCFSTCSPTKSCTDFLCNQPQELMIAFHKKRSMSQTWMRWHVPTGEERCSAAKKMLEAMRGSPDHPRPPDYEGQGFILRQIYDPADESRSLLDSPSPTSASSSKPSPGCPRAPSHPADFTFHPRLWRVPFPWT